tara:strand:+ start:257 stop:1141 length:885 start_codon:yes stop_codon:yes gene_type:complete
MFISPCKRGLVSVIIPGFKPDYILAAIESVSSQTYPSIEIIVVDDGSPHNLKSVLTPLIEQGVVNYIYQENQKMAAARNTGIKHCQGEFIAFLDDDDIWTSKKVAKQVSQFNQDDQLGLVYTFATGFNEQGDVPIANFEIANHGKIFTDIFLQDFIANSSVMVRRRSIEQVGLFNATPAYFGVDDCDMWTRITYHFNAVCIEEKLTRIRLHDKQFSGDRSIMLFNDLNARLTLIDEIDVPKPIQDSYLSRIYFDIGYNLRRSDKTKAAHYYIKSLRHQFSVKTLLAIVKLLINR